MTLWHYNNILCCNKQLFIFQSHLLGSRTEPPLSPRRPRHTRTAGRLTTQTRIYEVIYLAKNWLAQFCKTVFFLKWISPSCFALLAVLIVSVFLLCACACVYTQCEFHQVKTHAVLQKILPSLQSWCSVCTLWSIKLYSILHKSVTGAFV